MRALKFPFRFFLTLLALAFLGLPAMAHDPSKSYLSLAVESNGLTGQWDVPLKDLQAVVPLELTTDGLVTFEKLHARYPDITTYAFAHLRVSVDGAEATVRVTGTEPAVEEFADGSYLEIPFAVETKAVPFDKLEISYSLFFDTNSLHRGLLRLEANGITQTAVFDPDHRTQEFSLVAPSAGRQFVVFVREGIWHIWTGYDHILFLLALLLPSVLQREGGTWREVPALRAAFLNIFKIVTAFTVAHSLTLSLATLGIVRLPSRLTESAIAASVVLAAANNIWPLVRERGWMVAFGFGLVHGFGFATALSDLGLVHGALVVTLVGFNLGVEAGQLAIVAVFLPAAFALRGTWFYRGPLLRLGSAGIILVAGTWLAERVFDFKVLPF
jgi:hypothetical protein